MNNTEKTQFHVNEEVVINGGDYDGGIGIIVAAYTNSAAIVKLSGIGERVIQVQYLAKYPR
jgi:hypothetical protein